MSGEGCGRVDVVVTLVPWSVTLAPLHEWGIVVTMAAEWVSGHGTTVAARGYSASPCTLPPMASPGSV